jgi:hypothetical protein
VHLAELHQHSLGGRQQGALKEALALLPWF